jgi:hypothetical protein
MAGRSARGGHEGEATLAIREDLLDWVCEALKDNGGKAKIPLVAKHIWDNHERELQNSGDLFYTWQYDMRWATYKLRKQGKLTTKGEWALKY